ncbi:MAG: hypothetical protein QM704_19775 [Anaeromyxobacteraceae bacterium]
MEPSLETLPVWMGLAWGVLHTADHALTLAAARRRREGDLPARLDFGGSLELNPRFRAAVEAGRLLSRPFVLTLVAGALVLMAFCSALALAGRLPGAPWWWKGTLLDLGRVLLGAVVLGRLALVAGHLQNLALLRRMLTVPAAAGVRATYDRGTVFLVSRGRFFEAAGLLAVAGVATGSAFVWGGVAAALSLAAATYRWARRA